MCFTHTMLSRSMGEVGVAPGRTSRDENPELSRVRRS